MTYLELVNKVLTRLREETVSTVSQTTYSALIGEFVNDAKQIVEDAWDWSALRNISTVTTTASDYTYALPGVNDRAEVLYVSNDTSNVFMEYRSQAWFEQQLNLTGTVSGSPLYYTFNGFDASDDTQLMIYPIPDGVYSLRFKTVSRGGFMSDDTDELLVPMLPVVYLATALAARERGEVGGTSATELFSVADKLLSDAISLDARRHPEELVYQVV